MNLNDNPLVSLLDESMRLKDSAQHILSEALGEKSLTRLERLVLIAIWESDTPLTISQVGRILGHTRQVIQRSTNRLIDLGLLEKLPNPDHKTSALLQATDDGAAFARQLGNGLSGLVDKIFSDEDKALCRHMATEMKRLRELLETQQQNTTERRDSLPLRK